jgi:aminoglycoside phosphotransferase (APT) family kinase protein
MSSDEYAISIELVHELLGNQFPALKRQQVTFLGEGWASRTFLIDQEWVFRFPKRTSVERRLDIEIRLLPELSSSFGVAIPSFDCIGQSGQGYPFRFVGYRRLPGEAPLNLSTTDFSVSNLGKQLGGILASLHKYPTTKARGQGVTDESAADQPSRVKKDIQASLDHLRTRLSIETFARCTSIVTMEVPEYGGLRVLAHRDLQAEHIFLSADRSRVLGIIDWGDCGLSDPAVDFIFVKWLGRTQFENALSSYGRDLDPYFRQRVGLLALRFSLWDIQYGLSREKPYYIESGMTGISWSCGLMENL